MRQPSKMKCTVAGCEKPHQAIGYCPMHRRRFKLYGNAGEPTERHEKHGLRYTRTYRIWLNMKNRCQNPNATGYQNWGGRGITVCKDWQKFSNFLKDMGQSPPNMDIGRIDNDIGYSKENCRWETRTQNMRNTRKNKYLTYAGLTLCYAEWAEKTGLDYDKLSYRLRIGWDMKQILDYYQIKDFQL